MKRGVKRSGRFLVLLVSALALLFLVAATASAAEGPAVMVTGYTVDPAVLMPGDKGTITVTIKNMDTQSSESETVVTDPLGTSQQTTTTTSTRGISAEIETIRLSSKSSEIEWLSEVTQRDEYFNVGALGPGESIQVTLPIKASASARDGTYIPEVYIQVDNGENVRRPVHVEVDSSEVQLLEEDIPSEISLSESEEIEIVVANNRPNAVSGVNVFVNADSDALEFTPKGIFIGNLGAYEQKTVDFTVCPISEGAHDLDFEVTYKNGNNAHVSELSSSILVTGRSAVKLILVDAPEIVFQGDVGRIDFDVANGMAKDIKAVSVVPAVEGGKILPSEYFIGDMETGDVFSASFDVHTSEMDVGEATIPFTLLFNDVDTNRQYEIEGYEVQIEIQEPQESAVPNQGVLGIALVIIVLVVAVLWIRAKRKRRARE